MMQKDSKLFGTDFGQKVLDASTRNATPTCLSIKSLG